MGLLERIDTRPHDSPLPTEYLLDEAADCIIAMQAALEAYVKAYDSGTGTVYVNDQIRHALALSKGSEG